VRTTLDIDKALLEDVVRLSHERTRSGAVEEALREYVRLRRKELLMKLPGRVRLEEDWRALREAEMDERAGPG
jgi:Arc/MetJ family transcription regulator